MTTVDSDILRIADSALSSSINPKLGGIAQHSAVPELDPDELSGHNPRAILNPAGSLSSASFLGANSAFCDLFGFSKAELPISTFRILQVRPLVFLSFRP